jgi:hypothetical protein
MWCPYITKKIKCIKIILVTTIFGGLSMFSPCNVNGTKPDRKLDQFWILCEKFVTKGFKKPKH